MAEEQKKDKKKVLTAALAAGLAIALAVGGGTYAYLADSTQKVDNTIEMNKSLVDIDETPRKYEVIPGTSADKDPKLIADNTVVSYLYVKVDDETNGLVDWDIADGWTKLDGVDGVYYREVPANEDGKKTEYQILKDNQISYSADITNKDTTNSDGSLKDSVDLSFTGYIMQKAGFEDDPFSAYYAATTGSSSVTAAATAEALTEAIANAKDGDVITAKGVTVSDPLTVNKSVTLVGGTYENGVTVSAKDVTLDNVTVDKTVTAKNQSAVVVTSAAENFTMTDSTVSTNARTAINVSAPGVITLTDNTFNGTSDTSAAAYNCIELTQTKISQDANAGAADGTVISGNVIKNFSHNAVNVYSVRDGATITIENNKAEKVDGFYRLSNYNNVNYTANIYNNSSDKPLYDNDEWAGFGLLQDTDSTGEENNLAKVTINFKGNTVDGDALVNDNTSNRKYRAYYTYDDCGGVINATDNQPTVNFK